MHQYSKYSKYILNSLKNRVSFRRRPASKGLLNVRKWTSKPGFTPGIRILGTWSNTKNRVRQVTTPFSGEYAIFILSDRQRY